MGKEAGRFGVEHHIVAGLKAQLRDGADNAEDNRVHSSPPNVCRSYEVSMKTDRVPSVSQRAIKWVLLLLLLSGCTKAEERCKAINIQRILAHARELGDERIAREIADSAGPGFDLEKDNAIRRRLRARNTEPFNRDWQQKYPHDSTLWHHPAKDSAEPDPQPPPRPSDVAWYNEHCWEGKAR